MTDRVIEGIHKILVNRRVHRYTEPDGEATLCGRESHKVAAVTWNDDNVTCGTCLRVKRSRLPPPCIAWTGPDGKWAIKEAPVRIPGVMPS